MEIVSVENRCQPTRSIHKTQQVHLHFAKKEKIMDIEHLALNVPDPVRMAAWYVEHLGLRVLRKQEQSPNTHFLADRSWRVVLELYCHAKAAMPNYSTFDPLTLHIAFKADDVAAERLRLLAAGATAAGDIVTTEAGDVMTFVRDPWSVTIQLVKRLKPLAPDR
jgi:glyoxylase I family protein